MISLDAYLKQYIKHMVESDILWSNIQIYYSGVSVPGEGEHKIMDFIRKSIKSDDFKNGQHLIHGNDADLVFIINIYLIELLVVYYKNIYLKTFYLKGIFLFTE